jgi:hypothetical protein
MPPGAQDIEGNERMERALDYKLAQWKVDYKEHSTNVIDTLLPFLSGQ